MRIGLLYHSTTGNTQLACRYLAAGIPWATFELVDCRCAAAPDPQVYDVVGFATSVFYFGLPPGLLEAVQRLPRQGGKAAFVLATYGMMPGRALTHLDRVVTGLGFTVVGGHALMVPESYPPFIAKGWGNVDAPDVKEMARFDKFVVYLAERLMAVRSGVRVGPARVRSGPLNRLMRPTSVESARRKVGALVLDTTRCAGCGTCAGTCPSTAITWNEGPVFDPRRCQGCFACYNLCPQGAIRSSEVPDGSRYTGPSHGLKTRLAVSQEVS